MTVILNVRGVRNIPCETNPVKRGADGGDVSYDPATGNYVGPDGKPATKADLAPQNRPGWQDMLSPAGP